MNKKYLNILIAFGVIVILAGIIYSFNNASNNNSTKITIYKTQSCGCCSGYIAELETAGYNLDINIVEDLEAIKSKYNVSNDVESCHTAILGNYFIEGHVPLEALEKLMLEKPDIEGIILPRMPAGSPGMPGEKTEDFVVYSLNNGIINEYMRI